MRLQDCILDIDAVVSAPLQTTTPEEGWLEARGSGAIPESLFGLYASANYLSFGAAPGFLADSEKILFSYFAMLIRGLKDSLVEASVLASDFDQAQARVYDPGKAQRGEEWEKGAERRARSSFRYLTVTLSGALDGLAELIALFFTGRIPGIQLGRAEFARVEEWLQRPLSPAGLVVSPHEHHLESLYGELRPQIWPDGDERDWLPLLRLYRNKVAHMGDHMFRITGLHDDQGVFYSFMPRQWPYIWEKHLAPADPSRPPDQEGTRELLEETLVHQDLVTFVWGLVAKVQSVLGIACHRLRHAYLDLGPFPVNTAALSELEGNSRKYEFRHFDGDAA